MANIIDILKRARGYVVDYVTAPTSPAAELLTDIDDVLKRKPDGWAAVHPDGMFAGIYPNRATVDRVWVPRGYIARPVFFAD